MTWKKALDRNTLPVRKPFWLRKRLPEAGRLREMDRLLRRKHLHTVCESARCPNRWECFQDGQATFLVLGDRCTRGCAFCGIPKGRPDAPETDLPERIAAAVEILGLEFLVITSVTRDDLPDQGVGEFARTVEAIRRRSPGVGIELLIPDFGGDRLLLEVLVRMKPDVLGHNLETVERLYPAVRPGFRYRRSLEVLSIAKSLGQTITKSGLMLGLGETDAEVRRTLRDLREVGTDIVTLGQYLNPYRNGYPVRAYLAPEDFDAYREFSLSLGFRVACCGPFVRSSTGARQAAEQARGVAVALDRSGRA